MNSKYNSFYNMKRLLATFLALSLAVLSVGCASQTEESVDFEDTQTTVATEETSEITDSSDIAEETEPVEDVDFDISEPLVEYELEYYTFDDVILNSDVAIVGEYVETISYDSYTEQKFIVKECLYGNVTDEEIYLYSNVGIAYVPDIDYIYEFGDEKYTVGTDYILVMERLQSVFYEHDRYMCSTDVLLCEETGTYTIYSEPISVAGSVRDYVVDVYNSVAHEEVIEAVYESEAAELVGESKYIGVVTIDSLNVEGTVQNSNTYVCTVDSLMYGDNLNTYSDGSILLSVKKNTVEVGKSYVICFTSSSDTSLIYKQSTPDAVFELDDEMVSEIEGYISQNVTE